MTEPLKATDNVVYTPIPGGWRADRKAGFSVWDDDELIDTFDTQAEAVACAAQTANATGSELVGVEQVDAATEFIYLNPSLETDDGVPNVFLYQGVVGDPAADQPLHHYTMFDHHCSECGLERSEGHMPGCSKGSM